MPNFLVGKLGGEKVFGAFDAPFSILMGEVSSRGLIWSRRRFLCFWVADAESGLYARGFALGRLQVSASMAVCSVSDTDAFLKRW